MRRWLLIGLLSLFILLVVFMVAKPKETLVLPSAIQPSQSTDINMTTPTDTAIIKETWFTELSDSKQMSISTMDQEMQRVYEPTDRLFFHDSSATIDFYYRNIPSLSQTDIARIKADVTVTTKADHKSVPFTVTAFDEQSSQGITIHLNKVPNADLVVHFQSADGAAMKDFTFEYMPLFTFEVHSPEDKSVVYYANQSSTLLRVPPDQTCRYEVHFSLDVNQMEASKLLQAQFKDLDWSSEWKSSRDLTITLHTRREDIAKKFLINFDGVASTEGYVLKNWQVYLHGVIMEPKAYEALNVATGKTSTLFKKQPRYEKLILSPNKQYYLATELKDDFQGEFAVPSVSLLDANGDVIKHFLNAGYSSHWLPDGQAFVYLSGDSILSYEPAADRTKVIWTSPYKGIKTFLSSIDGLEVDPGTGRMAVSINRLPGTAMEKGIVELYLFENVNDLSPRKVKNVSERGNSAFNFQLDGKHIVYWNYYVAGVGDESRWESKMQWLDWKSLQINDITEIKPASYFHLYEGGEAVYQEGDFNFSEWFRYDLESAQSRSLFTAEHPIDAAWKVGKGQYIMHDFTGTFKFNLQKPQFAQVSLLPEKAEIVGSYDNTILYLQNPDPIGGN